MSEKELASMFAPPKYHEVERLPPLPSRRREGRRWALLVAVGILVLLVLFLGSFAVTMTLRKLRHLGNVGAVVDGAPKGLSGATREVVNTPWQVPRSRAAGLLLYHRRLSAPLYLPAGRL